MKSSLMDALGSRSVFLKYMRPVLGILASIRNAGEFGLSLILGIAIFAGGSGGVWLVVC